jgi:predicted RNA methylase
MATVRSKPGNTRVTGKEQYYTPKPVAREILDRVLKTTKASTSSPFLEPAAGAGAFVEAAKDLGFQEIIAMDIEPKHPEVVKADFLFRHPKVEHAICVTNPPFGRNNALSIPFFNKAAKHADVIAFVVPRSWRKWSVLNRLDRNFTLVDDFELTVDYVDEFDSEVHGIGNLRTCVQIWQRVEGFERNLIQIEDLGLFEKTTPEKADVAFTQFGYGCANFSLDFDRVPNSTKAFLRLTHPRTLEALRAVDFSRFTNHTAYTEAISLKELNFLLNEYLGLEPLKYSNDPKSAHYLGLNKPNR